jgi:hypothetical protein
MKRAENIMGKLLSAPQIVNESPFYLEFHIDVSGDAMPCMFIGNMARALRNNIRIGDKIFIPNAILDNGRLVFDMVNLELGTHIGRNVDTWA